MSTFDGEACKIICDLSKETSYISKQTSVFFKDVECFCKWKSGDAGQEIRNDATTAEVHQLQTFSVHQSNSPTPMVFAIGCSICSRVMDDVAENPGISEAPERENARANWVESITSMIQDADKERFEKQKQWLQQQQEHGGQVEACGMLWKLESDNMVCVCARARVCVCVCLSVCVCVCVCVCMSCAIVSGVESGSAWVNQGVAGSKGRVRMC